MERRGRGGCGPLESRRQPRSASRPRRCPDRRSPPCQRPSTRGRGARRSRTVSNQDCRHSSGHSRSRPGGSLFSAPRPASPATNSATPPLQPSHLPDSQLRTALSRLDAVDVLALLRVQVFVFQSPQAFVRGPVRHALSIALAILDASLIDDGHVFSCAWKLWLLSHASPPPSHCFRPWPPSALFLHKSFNPSGQFRFFSFQ